MTVKDKAVTVVVFMFFLNAVPGLLVGSGVAADMGVDLAISGGGTIDDANQAMQGVQVSGGFANTLFALYTSVTGPVRTLLGVLIGGELMFLSLGMPGWLVAFLFAPKYLLFGGALIYVLAGRAL